MFFLFVAVFCVFSSKAIASSPPPTPHRTVNTVAGAQHRANQAMTAQQKVGVRSSRSFANGMNYFNAIRQGIFLFTAYSEIYNTFKNVAGKLPSV